MSRKLYIQPPELVNVEGPLIFLGGPIQGAPLWQPYAAQLIHRSREIVVASPRKEYEPGTFVYEDQVDWETNYIKRASKFGALMFWLAKQTTETPGRSYAQTSRIELGEAKVRHEIYNTNLVIGIEPGFGNERYIRRRFGQDCPDVPILDNLIDTVNAALELVDK